MGRHILVVRASTPEGISEERFNAWYNEEHIPERLAIPGFHWAARYINVGGPGPRHMALYALKDESVLQSREYEVLANPNNWSMETQVIFPALMAVMERFLLRVRHGQFPASGELTFREGAVKGPGGEQIVEWVDVSSGRMWLSVNGKDVLISETSEPAPPSFIAERATRYERIFFRNSSAASW